MLQIKEICKQYKTGDLVQTALDHVSLNFRDNEFVAILGPSGSGKTTLLNIIGGLDRYDSGDLIINGITTRKYKDKDWDSYRNHTIGFIFQSYNLIPHQSVLANVELALTISGISRGERRKRAKEALEKVGLGNQLHKRPNQMSGGQMQRVAIARALVNDPDILLADEPTGALDSETSIQVMDLLKEVAKDKLVIMVTHNPELAEDYANRIVRVKDGKILDDTHPFVIEKAYESEATHKNMGKSSMSRLTALSLSFNNLRTKKGRTILTAFAGSIGIIGIALILSLSTGVNNYINDLQKDTMTSYPISIDAKTFDLSSVMKTGQEKASGKVGHKKDAVYTNTTDMEMASAVSTSITENNLTSFKKYLDDKSSKIHDYIGENGIVYSYATSFSVLSKDTENILVDLDSVNIGSQNAFTELGYGGNQEMSEAMYGSMMTSSYMDELLPNKKGYVSDVIKKEYDLVAGNWPEKATDIVLKMDSNNEIDINALYGLGLLPSTEYKTMINAINAGEEYEFTSTSWSYEDLLNREVYLLPTCDQYIKNDNGTWSYIGDNAAELEKVLDHAFTLKVSAIIRPNKDTNSNMSSLAVVGYTQALTNEIIAHTDESQIVKEQKDNPNTNVLSGLAFTAADDAAKAADAKTYLKNLNTSDKAKMMTNMMAFLGQDLSSMSETELAGMLDMALASEQLDDASLVQIYDTYISTGTYDDNLATLGVVSLDAPSSVSIYCDDFESKDKIADCIQEYNEKAKEEDKITYTDYVGLLMSSVTTIINVISYVLIAFVSVSLIVSSIMIGIITYISVLERTKEIGILRAIGASKKNISTVFNSETLIIGLLAGLIGIGVSALLLIPGNAIIHSLTDNTHVNAVLPWKASIFLVILSTLLTMIGGLIPSKKAAKKDPVTALRTE